MRRLCRLVTGVSLLATLALGCGSSQEDGIVMRFITFAPSDSTQNDTVTATSAEVCVNNPNLPINLRATLTPTSVNAIFVNEEQANIHLLSYTVHFNDPSIGLADVTASISGNPTLIGGMCSTGLISCAVDADCLTVGGTTGSGTGGGETCDHAETTVDGIVLVDVSAKSHVNPKLFGQATSLTVTFVGADDANRTFEVNAGYAIVFSDDVRCGRATNPTAVTTPAATATALPTATPTIGL